MVSVSRMKFEFTSFVQKIAQSFPHKSRTAHTSDGNDDDDDDDDSNDTHDNNNNDDDDDEDERSKRSIEGKFDSRNLSSSSFPS